MGSNILEGSDASIFRVFLVDRGSRFLCYTGIISI
jgi:hypothetical protein